MSGSASDNDIVLDNLGVDEENRLKGTAHIVFGIDDALQNIFKSSGEKVGRKILAVEELGHKVLHRTTSLVMRGSIVLPKCLSLSHVTLRFHVTFRLCVEF